jgi:hypothetical protein
MQGSTMNDAQIEFLTLRSEDFARNFHSLREVEWHTTYQEFAGFAAIAVAFDQVHKAYPITSAIAGVLLVLLLFCTGVYLARRIQERLHYTRDMQNAYLNQLHVALDVPVLPTPSATREPLHHRQYSFAVQMVLKATIATTVMAYMLSSK